MKLHFLILLLKSNVKSHYNKFWLFNCFYYYFNFSIIFF